MTTKPDELALWEAVKSGELPRYAGERLGIPRKRVDYLCHKWSSRGDYDYGVCVDMGWAVNVMNPAGSDNG